MRNFLTIMRIRDPGFAKRTLGGESMRIEPCRGSTLPAHPYPAPKSLTNSFSIVTLSNGTSRRSEIIRCKVFHVSVGCPE